MKKFLSTVLLLLHYSMLACPITITNDHSQKFDLIIADGEHAHIVRASKKETVGRVGKPTTFLVYTAKKAGDTENFFIAYQVTEKECPPDEKKRKKKVELTFSQLQARSQTDIEKQKHDDSRFVVESLVKSKAPK